MTLVLGLSGCYSRNEVAIAYGAFATNKDTAVRYGPDPNAPVVSNGTMAKGNGFCRQSTRNPGCSSAPPLRDASNGFVWGYKRDGSIAGWVPAADVDAQSGATPCCGPAGADFSLDNPSYANCPKNCGGSVSSGSARSERRTILKNDATFRYAPQSTQFRWLLNGDVCDVRAYSEGYYCVRVVSARYTPAGAEGFVITTAFDA